MSDICVSGFSRSSWIFFCVSRARELLCTSAELSVLEWSIFLLYIYLLNREISKFESEWCFSLKIWGTKESTVRASTRTQKYMWGSSSPSPCDSLGNNNTGWPWCPSLCFLTSICLFYGLHDRTWKLLMALMLLQKWDMMMRNNRNWEISVNTWSANSF